eukprot:Tamp_36207.p1 GENE.Tamp_36207~~Tamp_36207.p1  ORF type:complete len:139 (+),score=6.93 Tamp_36207:133-549(+)
MYCAVISPAADGHCGAAASGIRGIDMADEPVLTPRSTASGAPTECNTPIRQGGPWAGLAPNTCAQESPALGALYSFPTPNPDPTRLPPPSESDERGLTGLRAITRPVLRLDPMLTSLSPRAACKRVAANVPCFYLATD